MPLGNELSMETVKPARMSLRDEQKLMTRERLLSGALEVFETKGYPLATVDDITTQAGASRATFYLHFKTKFEVIEALHAKRSEEVEDLFAELDSVVVEGKRIAIRKWVDRALRWYESNTVYALSLEQAILMERDVAAAMRRPYLQYMPNLRDAWPEQRHEEANMRLWLIVKSMTAVFIGRSIYKSFTEIDRSAVVDTLVDLCMGTIVSTDKDRRKSAGTSTSK